MTQNQFYASRTRPSSGSYGRTKSGDPAGGAGRTSYSSSSSASASRGGSGKRKKAGIGGGVGGKRAPSDWRVAGGPGRDHSVLIELELDKVLM